MKQTPLFKGMPEPEDWREEWAGMPEFVQDKRQAYAQIICRFDNEEDLQAFAALIGQRLTRRTKSIWYPFKSHWGNPNKRWVDESKVSGLHHLEGQAENHANGTGTGVNGRPVQGSDRTD